MSLYGPTPAAPCRLCALTRAAWQALRLLLLPRVLAFGGALVVLALMAPSGIPTPKRPPAKPAAGEVPAGPAAASAAASAPAAPAGVPGQMLTTTTTVTTTVTTTGPVAASAPAAAAATPLGSASAAPASSPSPAAAAITGVASGSGVAPGQGTAGATRAGAAPALPETSGSARSAGAASGALPAAKGASAPGGEATTATATAVSAGAVQPLRFRGVATLPSARAGVRWGPHVVLEQGQPPYTLRFIGGKPAWMEEPVGGALAGTPPKAETVVFTLEGASKSDPARVVSQTYRVQVLAAAKPALPAASARLFEVKPEEAQAAARRAGERDVPITWRLDAGDVKTLVKDLLPLASEGDGLKAELRALTQTLRAALSGEADLPRTGPAAESPGPMLPTARQLNDMLEPFLDVDYPTEAHFRKALEVAHCGYYKHQMRLIAMARNPGHHDAKDDATCPTLPTKAPEPGPLTGPVSPAAYFSALLPAPHVEDIVKKARKPHRVDPGFDANWTATDGCGCVSPVPVDEVHTFIPHWGTTEQQQASPPDAAASAPGAPVLRKPAPRQTDFSLFTRVSFFGAMLNDLGDAELPPAVSDAGRRLSHEAMRHGTRVDLVVYRNEWESLLPRLRQRDGDLERFAERAADSTMQHVDARQRDKWLHRMADTLLLPFWRDEVHAYAGVTVFFDNLPRDDSPLAAPFKTFHKAFVDALLVKMRDGGRQYGLNIVVPDDRATESGLFDFKAMQDLILRAEPRPRNKLLHKEDLAYTGKTDIRVSHVVMLSDPTTRTKKKLRERVDQSSEVTGARRVMVLDSMVPMLLRPMAVKSQWAIDDPAQQFKDDLAYLSWTFGGAAVWEPPGRAKDDEKWAKAMGDKVRLDMLAAKFRGEPTAWTGLCNWVCPKRVGLRLILQSLVVANALVLAIWFASCAARTFGWRYKALLWALAFPTGLLAFAMLKCDPALRELNEGQAPLLVAAGVLLLAGLYWTFRPRRERP